MDSLSTQKDALFAAVAQDDFRQVRRLVATQLSPYVRNEQGQTPLAMASQRGNLEIMRLLHQAAMRYRHTAPLFFGSNIISCEPVPEVALGNSLLASWSAQVVEPMTVFNAVVLRQRAFSPQVDHAAAFIEKLAQLAQPSNTEEPSPHNVAPPSAPISKPVTAPTPPPVPANPNLRSSAFQPSSADAAPQTEPDSVDAVVQSELDSIDAMVRPGHVQKTQVETSVTSSAPAPGTLPTVSLEAAVQAEDVGAVKLLLQAGVDLRPPTWYERPALVIAAEQGHAEIVQLLVAAGANVNGGYERLPLHAAGLSGRVDILALLLKAGADRDATAINGWTALMTAAAAGQMSAVQYLAEQGAQLQIASAGDTAASLAMASGHDDIYRWLCAFGTQEGATVAPPQSATQPSRAALSSAQRIPDQLVEPPSLPVAAAASAQPAPSTFVQSRNSSGQQQTISEFVNCAASGQLAQLMDFMSAGVSINTLTAEGRTALTAALYRGHRMVVQALLQAGADPNLPGQSLSVDRMLRYPLMVAVTSPVVALHRDFVALLVAQGAQIDQVDAQGQTALMHAAKCSHMEAIAALLESDADAEIRDYTGYTALMHASSPEAMQCLQQHSDAQHQALLLLRAVVREQLEQVSQMVTDGVDVNVTVEGITPLAQASAKGSIAIARCLIQAGADVDLRTHTTSMTPLMYAAYRGHLEMVRVLIDAGANAMLENEGHLTAISYAELGQRQGFADQPFEMILAVLRRVMVPQIDPFADRQSRLRRLSPG